MSDTPIGPLLLGHHMVVKLEIVSEDDAPVDKHFKLQEGVNIFRCMATYIDGSRRPYAPYWTCPLILRRDARVHVDLWGVLGKQRRETATIHASTRQERYTELAAWVFEPDQSRHNEFPRSSIGFDYSLFE